MKALMTAAVLVFLALQSARADESRIPLYAPANTSSTIVINAPGSYILTGNITSSASKVIEIQSDYVSIDLNGRTISNTGNGPTIYANGYGGISIKNGNLVGGLKGIHFEGIISGLSTIRLEQLTIENTTTGATYLTRANADVISCRFHNVNTQGIFGGGAQAAVVLTGSGRVIGNSVSSTSQGGFFLNTNGAEFRDNIVNNFNQAYNSHAGLNLTSGDGNLVQGNTFSLGGNATAILVEAGSTGHMILNNVIYGVGTGIKTESSGNRISGNNLIQGTCGIDIDTGGSNLIEDNVVTNFSIGLRFVNSSSNVYRDNMLKANTLAVQDPGALNTNAGGNIL